MSRKINLIFNIYLTFIRLQFKCKDDIVKAAVAARFKKIVFSLDAENKIVSGDSQYSSFYELVLDSEGSLHVNVNLNKYDSSFYHLSQKLDNLLNVRLAQDQRASYKALADHETRFMKEFGFGVQLDVDWTFASHEKFTKEDLDWRSARITRLAHNIIGSFLFNAGDA